MTDFTIDGGETPRRPRANLGTPDEEDIFAAFDTRILRRFLAYLKPHRGLVFGAQAAVLVSSLTSVATPWLIGAAVNAAVARDVGQLERLMLEFGFLVLINTVANFGDQWMTSRLAQRVIFDVRRSMFAHFQDVALTFLDKTHVGRIMSRLQGDVNALQEFLESSTGALGDFTTLIGYSVVLVWMDWKLGLLTLTTIPALIVARAFWLPYSKRTFRRARDASSIANGALAENINGVRTVQETRREALNFELYEEKARENFDAAVSSAWLAQVMTPTVDMLTGAAMAMIIVVGGDQVLGGHLAVGVLVTFILSVQRFFEPVRLLSMQYTVMQRAMAAGYRIFEVLDVPVTIADAPGAVVLKDVESTIELDHVTFGYAPGRPILNDVSLTVRPREVVALVGPTGSGKTSITSLVHRFYEADSGVVRVGGFDVRDVTLGSLGSVVGMVLQEPFLFSGTIEENIRYNTARASLDDVVAAARAVSAHEFIVALPEGYDTQLGQRGRNLSVGQRQLLSFARALIANPRILILDEATANIDSFTEQAIQKALKVLFAGRTCLIIAHRLATVRDADTIFVLNQGRIVEQGPHAALVARGGLYARLYASSHGSFDDLEDVGDRTLVAT
ncbi:MAG TPA: ABC transporter ATP-binding protein [Caulobacteraceae bacterium]|nr:ABC transporter ATP-binding protein [Caulobacteraceae bacterium]